MLNSDEQCIAFVNKMVESLLEQKGGGTKNIIAIYQKHTIGWNGTWKIIATFDRRASAASWT